MGTEIKLQSGRVGGVAARQGAAARSSAWGIDEQVCKDDLQWCYNCVCSSARMLVMVVVDVDVE